MFYKLIFTLFIFSSFCFSSNDIQNLKSFQSKFTQTITSSSSDIITYQGEVFIKSSGQDFGNTKLQWLKMSILRIIWQ